MKVRNHYLVLSLAEKDKNLYSETLRQIEAFSKSLKKQVEEEWNEIIDSKMKDELVIQRAREMAEARENEERNRKEKELKQNAEQVILEPKKDHQQMIEENDSDMEDIIDTNPWASNKKIEEKTKPSEKKLEEEDLGQFNCEEGTLNTPKKVDQKEQPIIPTQTVKIKQTKLKPKAK